MIVALCALIILIGLAGIVLPILPGGAIVVGAGVLLWAWAGPGTATAWVVFTVAAVILLIGTITKFAVPGRNLKSAGIPLATQLAGAVAGIIGFFVVPVIGLILGFVLGVYLAELRRVGRGAAWASTRQAVRAAATSILIDLSGALLATGVWVVGVLAS